jgi:hypothetical protein
MYVLARTELENLHTKQTNLPIEQARIKSMTNQQAKAKAQNDFDNNKAFIESEIEQYKQRLLKSQAQIAPISEFSATFKNKHPDVIIDTLIPVYYQTGKENFRDLRRQLNLKIMEDGPVYKPMKEEHYLHVHNYYQNPEYKRVRQNKHKNPEKEVIRGPWSYKHRAENYWDTNKYSDILMFKADDGYIYQGQNGNIFFPSGGENASEISNNGKKRLITQILQNESQKEIEKRAGIKRIDWAETNKDGYIKHFLSGEDENFANYMMATYGIRRMKIKGIIYQPEDFN